MLIENGLSDAVGFFHLDALSSAVALNVDFDVLLTVVGSAIYRLLARGDGVRGGARAIRALVVGAPRQARKALRAQHLLDGRGTEPILPRALSFSVP